VVGVQLRWISAFWMGDKGRVDGHESGFLDFARNDIVFEQ
jgi:hypothetical protein